MKGKKCLSVAVILAMVAGLLAGCGGSGGGSAQPSQPAQSPAASSAPTSTPAPATPAASQTPATTKDTLVIAQNADIYSMDPQLKKDVPSGRIKTLVFETLVYINDNNEIVPGLAESWEIVDDTTIHFTIPKGVKFHNGEELTMEDIIYSFERGVDAPQTSTTMEPIDVPNSKAIDDTTFEMKLKYPYGAILSNLADTCCSIVDKSYIEEVGADEFALKPIGTGPYVFDSWTSGDRVELSRYEDYHGTLPAIKNITFRVITEAANRTIELETGNVDIALDIAPADVSNVEGNPDLVLERGANYSVTYMAMNASKEPFDNAKVRKAITLALDLPSIVGAVYEGTGSVGRGPLSESVWGFNEDIQPYQQNIEEAKALLAEAGFPDGFSCEILTSDHQQRMDFCEIAQNQLRAIGIDCKVEIMEWGAYLDAIFAGEHEMTVLGYSYGFDPCTGLTNVFGSENFGANGNIAWYKNDRVDQLLEAAKTEMDDASRKEMIMEAQVIINEDAPWVFIWQGENLNGLANNLRGFKNMGNSMYRFMDVYFE